MSAIVIVFMPGHDGRLVTEQAAALRAVDSSPQSTDSGNTRSGLGQTSDLDETTPPFWTWFIENPRTSRAR
jgi:hypothetical protein